MVSYSPIYTSKTYLVKRDLAEEKSAIKNLKTNFYVGVNSSLTFTFVS